MADRPMGCGVIQDLLPLYVDGLLQETVVVGKDGVGHGRYGMA